jgi:hypothetical protein
MTEGGETPQKRSRQRRDVETALKEENISQERKITMINLDSGQKFYFDDYSEAMDFMKANKGRWYMATPGIRHKKDSRS